MATHAEVMEALRGLKRAARSNKHYEKVVAHADELLELMSSPGDKEAKKARFVRGRNKKPRPKKIMEQPVHSGQIPQAGTKEFAE